MKFTFLLIIVASIGSNCFGQTEIRQNFNYNIDGLFVDTMANGQNAFLIKSEHTSNNYNILINDTLSAFTEDQRHSKIEILGSQNLDSVIYYYFIEKVDKNLMLSAIAFHKYKKGGYEVSEIYTFDQRLLTYYFDDNFYLFFYNEEVNLLNIAAINGGQVVFEKSIINKMPFFADHIDKANPIIPINNQLPVSTFESSFKNKVYKENNKFIFTFDMYIEEYNDPFRYGNSTEILEVDLSNDLSNYTIIRVQEDEMTLLYNSFYLDNTLYRLSISHDFMNIAAYEITSKSLINEHAIYKSDSFGKLASSPHYARVGTKHTLSPSRFKKMKKLLQAHYVGTPSISAYNVDKDIVQLTIGYYYNDQGIFILIGGASILHSIIVSALTTAIMNVDTGVSSYFYSNFSKADFIYLPEYRNTLSRKVDDLEVGMVNNKNKMRVRKYYRSSNRLKFIYQDFNSKRLHIIE